MKLLLLKKSWGEGRRQRAIGTSSPSILLCRTQVEVELPDPEDDVDDPILGQFPEYVPDDDEEPDDDVEDVVVLLIVLDCA